MNKILLIQAFHFPKYVFLISGILTLISCESSRKIQTTKALPETEKSEPMQVTFQQKAEEGIDFFATGLDSGWTLDLDFEKDFKFKRSDGFVFSTPAVIGHQAQDANVVRFRAQVESGEMIIQIYQEQCLLGKTGQKFSHRVKVEVRRGIDKDFMIFEGCGNYIFDQRIHDIWVLHTLNDQVVTAKELPYIEFNTTTASVLGKTGCNNFSGKVSFSGNKLTMNPLAVTRKLCPEAALEGEFLKAISPGEMEYRVDNGKLFLSRNGIETIVFRKVD